MPDSLIGILIAIAAVLPGFVITELSLVNRPGGGRSDLEIVLRALFYALVLHLVFGFYTVKIIDQVGSIAAIPDHLGEVSIYVATVLVAVPLIVGLALNRYFREQDQGKKEPSRLYSILGAHQPQSAGDVLAARLRQPAWIIIETNDGAFVGGEFAEGSAAGQAPGEHDYFIVKEWVVKEDSGVGPVLVGEISPSRGIYVPANSVKSVRINF